MKCPVCNTSELVGKQKYCSGACRVRASRNKDSARPMAQVAQKTDKVVDEIVAQASPEEVVRENIESPENPKVPTIQDLRQRFGDQFKIEVSDQDLAQVGTEVWNNRLQKNITVGLCKFGPCLDPDCKTRFVLDVLK